MRLQIGLLLVAGLSGCIDHPDPPEVPEGAAGSMTLPPVDSTPQPTGKTQQTTAPAATPKDPVAMLPEVVYVFQKDYDGGDWMCTGTAISKDLVITAAHCLDPNQFASFAIIAPSAPNRPRITASRPASESDEFANVSNPDVGVLRLDAPLVLPAYAELTDVTDRVEKGEKISALAIVRTKEEPLAPFKSSGPLTVTSTVASGYSHGFATEYFSHGGDSGAGLFLIENGQPTHKLIGVARQPEPDQKRDHFTRIDAAFMSWFQDNAAD